MNQHKNKVHLNGLLLTLRKSLKINYHIHDHCHHQAMIMLIKKNQSQNIWNAKKSPNKQKSPKKSWLNLLKMLNFIKSDSFFFFFLRKNSYFGKRNKNLSKKPKFFFSKFKPKKKTEKKIEPISVFSNRLIRTKFTEDDEWNELAHDLNTRWR